MNAIRKLLLLSVGVLALYGLQACSAGTELNPQPLPPEPTGGGERTPSGGGAYDGKNGTGAAAPMAPTPASDAGAEGGDASDAGAG